MKKIQKKEFTNEDFLKLSKSNINNLKTMKYHDEEGRTVEEELTHMISTIGENIQLGLISTIKSER